MRRFLRCQSGTTAIEYAFIAGLVSIGIVTAVSAMSGSVTSLFTSLSSTITGAANGYEEKLLGALNFTEEKIESALNFNADLYEPAIGPQAKADHWRLSGIVVSTDSVGGSSRTPFTAVLENLCPDFAKSSCWRVEELVVAGQPVDTTRQAE